MDSATHKRRTEFLLRWSPLFLVAACGLFLVSLSFSSLSLRYSISSAVLGFALALAMVGCWRLETRSHLNMFIALLVVISWRGADWLLQQWIFHGAQVPGWLDFQGAATNFIALFVMLSVFRRQIHRFVFDDAEEIVGRERRERVSHHDWSGDA